MAIQLSQFNPQMPMPTLAAIDPQTAAANRRAGILDAILGGGGSFGGLVGTDDQDVARQRGLLAMGAQMMQAGGPSPVRTSFGQALGQGLLAGQGAQQQSLQQALQAQLMQSQMARAQQQRAKPVAVVGDDGNPLYVPEDEALGRQPFYNNAAAPRKPASIEEYELAKSQGFEGSFQEWVRERARYSVGAPYQIGEVAGATGAFDRRGGGFTPLSSAEQEAQAVAGVAAAKTTAEAEAKSATEARANLPKVEAAAQQMLGVIDQLKTHPGLKHITGGSSLLPIIPGTAQAGADALAKQIQGQTFLQAFESLKGGGPITDVEGAKAEAAIARLNRAQSTKEYTAALDDLAEVVTSVRDRAKRSAGSGPNPEDPLGIR